MIIRIDATYIEELERRCWRILMDLSNVRFASGGFESAPPVANALADYQGRWEESRHEITESLRALTKALNVIRSSFQETDTRLEISLTGGDE